MYLLEDLPLQDSSITQQVLHGISATPEEKQNNRRQIRGRSWTLLGSGCLMSLYKSSWQVAVNVGFWVQKFYPRTVINCFNINSVFGLTGLKEVKSLSNMVGSQAAVEGQRSSFSCPPRRSSSPPPRRWVSLGCTVRQQQSCQHQPFVTCVSLKDTRLPRVLQKPRILWCPLMSLEALVSMFCRNPGLRCQLSESQQGEQALSAFHIKVVVKREFSSVFPGLAAYAAAESWVISI